MAARVTGRVAWSEVLSEVALRFGITCCDALSVLPAARSGRGKIVTATATGKVTDVLIVGWLLGIMVV